MRQYPLRGGSSPSAKVSELAHRNVNNRFFCSADENAVFTSGPRAHNNILHIIVLYTNATLQFTRGH